MGWSAGVNTEPGTSAAERRLTNIDSGDWIGLSGVDFGSQGARAFSASVLCLEGGGSIELHLDDPAGRLIGELTVPAVSRTEKQQQLEVKTAVSGAEGVHDLYLVFKGKAGTGLFKLEAWQFIE
jgi:arabinoxylan arabinofuranohydrolase